MRCGQLRFYAICVMAFFATGCTVILTERPPLNSTSQWSGIALSVTSPATAITVGAETSLAFNGTAKPSALEKSASRITSIKVKWPTGEIQSYNPNLPAGTVTVTAGATSVANQNWSISVSPVLSSSGKLTVWAEDSWRFYTDPISFNLNP